MVFTLQRYIFRELLRIFILATIALTLILSLGGILRPVQQYGVGPRQAVHILVYLMPVTLTFVLPMAALFASALAYGRLASDNELDACRASGISMLTMVYPGLTLAILVAIANLLLSFHVMPYFVHLAEKSLKADARQIVFRNIERSGYYEIPTAGSSKLFLYADEVDPRRDALYGIISIQATASGIRRIITLDGARVQFDPHDKFNEVRLTTYNVRQTGAPADDTSARIGEGSFTMEFGSLLGDKVKFKKIDEMKSIRANLMLFDPVARLAREVYVQLVTELLAQDIRRTVASGEAYELKGETLSFRFSGTACELQEYAEIALAPPVVVEERDESGLRRRLKCERAEIYVDDATLTPRLTLRLHNPKVEETGQLLVQYVVGDLPVPEAVGRSLGGRAILEVVTTDAGAELGRPPSPILAKRQEELLRRVNDALADIKSEMNSRLVFGIGCVPMILIGIGLGILQRGGHLLSAFGASCLPAVVLIVTIISGKNVTENADAHRDSGLLVMWGGLAFLLLLTAVIYRKLQRT